MKHAVVIIGGGPTGMMLGCELALAKVDVAIVERRADQALDGVRARGFHSRTIEVLDQRGVAERFLVEGKKAQIGAFVFNPLDISSFPTRHNYGLGLGQDRFERILAGWMDELGVRVYRNATCSDLAQDDAGVTVTLEDGRALRADYLVGCDGGRSLVRKRAGIDFPGWDPSLSWIIAEAQLTEKAPFGLNRDDKGFYALSPTEDGKRIGILVRDAEVTDGQPTEDDLRAALVSVYGSDFGIHDVTRLSRFTDMTRQAAAYRDKRVLLAGDAAHIHAPAGGQGLNLGIQDAVNLGWKLAQVVKGVSPESLLDTYHSERHPIAARVCRTTMAAVSLQRGDARTMAVNEVIADLLKNDETKKRYAAMIASLDIHYDVGGDAAHAHPLLGHRMPDLDIVTKDGPRRVFELLHDARPLFISFEGALEGEIDLAPWKDRVRFVEATFSGTWELPVRGVIQPPTAVLVRPDGHVAWVGTANGGWIAGDLREALKTWFGA